MSIKWINYKGKKILYADYRGMSNIKKMLHDFEEEIKNISSNEDVLVLDDFRDSNIENVFMKRAKKEGKKNILKMKKHAFLGLTGFKGFLLKSYNKLSGDHAVKFSSEFAAKEFLVKE